MMEEVVDDFDPDNDIAYGKSNKGHEVMIISWNNVRNLV